MTDVPEVVKFRRYLDNDTGEYLISDVLPQIAENEWNEWEEKLLDAIGYETGIEFTWNTVTNEVTIAKI